MKASRLVLAKLVTPASIEGSAAHGAASGAGAAGGRRPLKKGMATVRTTTESANLTPAPI